jgi:hypothetical protein
MRPMRRQDWIAAPIAVGEYCNDEPLSGYQRRDGRGGNALYPADADDRFEDSLTKVYAHLCERCPWLRIDRYFVHMPYWEGPRVPGPADYTLVDAPRPLATTSVTVLIVPQSHISATQLGFHYHGSTLPSLRQRLQGQRFRGLVGNVGYYMTEGLIRCKFPWSHNRRYPDHPLPPVPSYLGYYLRTDTEEGTIQGGFQGALPAAVGLAEDGRARLISQPHTGAYQVTLGEHTFVVDAVNDPQFESDCMVFTPACRTAEASALIGEAEQQPDSTAWQSYAPMVPVPEAADRVHVFVANRGDGEMPAEEIVDVWPGPAPLPSFGAVLSFRRAWFEAHFGSIDRFRAHLLATPVSVVPLNSTFEHGFRSALGGLVPAVIEGQHVCRADTVSGVMQLLGRYGNTTSPIARAGQESRNFHPYVREPAGLLVQTKDEIGWVLLDGRHELSIGASVVDALQILYMLDTSNAFGSPLEEAVFVDGGSAMKLYYVESDGEQVRLDLLNRVAAGSRNGPGHDVGGLNLYSTLSLDF